MATENLNNLGKHGGKKKIRERSFLPGYVLKIGTLTNVTNEFATMQIGNHKLNFVLDVFEENADELKQLIGQSTVMRFNSKREFKAVTSNKYGSGQLVLSRKRAKHMLTWQG